MIVALLTAAAVVDLLPGWRPNAATAPSDTAKTAVVAMPTRSRMRVTRMRRLTEVEAMAKRMGAQHSLEINGMYELPKNRPRPVASLEPVSTFSAPDIEVTPAQARELVDAGAQLVDVREGYEHEAGRIAGARHIELERLAAQAETIDRDRAVVFQCRIGARSAMAAQAFRAAGYEAYTMTGGLQRWFDEGLPLEPEGGHVADH